MEAWFTVDREVNDIDWVTTQDRDNTIGIEHHVVPRWLYDLFESYSIDSVLSADALYTLKISHLPWEGGNGKWGKHLSDAVFMKDNGCKLLPHFHSCLIEFWKGKFSSKSHIKFTKSPDEFFKDSLNRDWDHDKLHRYFKVGDIPAYTNIVKSSESVLTSEYLFSKLDTTTQLLTVLEEVFVVAFERNLSLADGYKYVVTRLSKGWWNTFALDNAKEILKGFTDEKKSYSEKRRNLNKGEHNELRKSV